MIKASAACEVALYDEGLPASVQFPRFDCFDRAETCQKRPAASVAVSDLVRDQVALEREMSGNGQTSAHAHPERANSWAQKLAKVGASQVICWHITPGREVGLINEINTAGTRCLAAWEVDEVNSVRWMRT